MNATAPVTPFSVLPLLRLLFLRSPLSLVRSRHSFSLSLLSFSLPVPILLAILVFGNRC